MSDYRERLWPSPWIFLSTALVIPASILVLAPINLTVGFITAGVLYAAIVVALLMTTPLIEVRNGMLQAGSARVPLTATGLATPAEGEEARRQRGVELDARAWLLIRGWVHGLVRVPIDDPADPVPYWVVSSRHPGRMAEAINSSRRS